MTGAEDGFESLEEGKDAIQLVKAELGPFVVAADDTRMPIAFINAKSEHQDIVYANQSFLDLTGYKISQAIGLPFQSLLAENEPGYATLEVIADEGEGTLDLRCRRKNHTEFEASVLASRVCDKDGELQQYFVCLMDLTEQIEKRLQPHLREVEIYKHAPGFIAFTEGPDHRFSYANTAYETLVGRQNLIGGRVVDLLPEVARQGFIKVLDKVYREGERITAKKAPIDLNRGSNGEVETRYVDFIYEPVRDPSGDVVGIFVEGSDVTDIQAVSQRMQDMQNESMHVARINAMGTMAATLAHEINQPLAAIANYASGCLALNEQGGHSEQVSEGLRAIASATDRAGKIIRGLRAMTKRTKMAHEVFDLSTALEESVHLVRVGGCHDVLINTECASSLLVSGNEVQIQQVLVNLLRNACEATFHSNREGEVQAIALRKDGKSCVVVRDTGLGLPDSMKADIFAWKESTKIEGMGMGLSICRTIAEAHGGEITLDETGPSGTTFTFCLPKLAIKTSPPILA